MIYTSIVIPVFTYCGTVNLNLLRTSLGKLDRIHKRPVGIITKTNPVKLTPIMNYVKRHACQIVRTLITRQLPAPMTNYFQMLSLKVNKKQETLDSISKNHNKNNPKWILSSRRNDLQFFKQEILICKKIKICF